MSAVPALAGCAVLLAGCMTGPIPIGAIPISAADNAPTIGFQCPKPGTAVTYGASSLPVTSAGADPADPLVCLGSGARGAPLRRVANLIEPPPGQERAIRDGLAPLFPIVPGKTAQFGYFQGYRNERTATGQFMEAWTTVGPDTLQIGGKPVPTIVFTRGIENNQRYGTLGIRWRLWFAPESGVWVRGEPTLLRGDANPRPFVATSLLVP